MQDVTCGRRASTRQVCRTSRIASLRASTRQTCKHASVVEYIETFMFDSSLFIVMELMDGGSLTNIIQACLLPA